MIIMGIETILFLSNKFYLKTLKDFNYVHCGIALYEYCTSR